MLLLAQGLMISGPMFIGHAIDNDILKNRDPVGLRHTVLGYLGVQLGYLITLYLMRNWLEWTGQHMMAALRKQLVDHLLALPLSFHDRTTPGKLLSRVESDTQALRVLFTTTAVMLLGDLILFFGMFAVMFRYSARLALVCAVIIPIMLGLSVFFQRRIHPVFVRARELNSEVASRLTELLQAMPVVQAFARERWAASDLQAKSQRKFDVVVAGERDIVVWFNAIHALQTVAMAIVMGFGGYWTMTGVVTVGILVVFISYIRRFFQPLLRLSEQLAMIQKAFAAAERLFLLLAEPNTVPNPAVPRDWPDGGCSIAFEGVWFRYESAGDEDTSTGEPAGRDWVLRDLSFSIPAGETIALIGPTGSGKTTIISLLQRFYDPQRGRILVDGVDIRELDAEVLRRHIGVVPQDIYLFSGSLADNLVLGNAYDHAAVQRAARSTLAERFVERLPQGYESVLTERGANLSLGQRQLLSFTRALLREPEIVILDEATSAVDPATEAAVAAATQRSLEDRTAIIIAHRLSTIRAADCILVLDQGRIIQQGTHEELIGVAGLYRTLQELQYQQGSGLESA